VPQRLELARPPVRAATGLQRHPSRRALGKKLNQLLPSELAVADLAALSAL
jgi:hypothetical protein